MHTINNVLVLSDFSETSEKCLAYGIDLCALCGAQLTVLHAYRLTSTGQASLGGLAQKVLIERNAQNKLDKLREKFLKKTKIRYQLKLELGFVPDAVNRIVETEGINLVITSFAGQGQAPFSGRKIGQIARELIGEIDCPMLLLPSNTLDFLRCMIIYSSLGQASTLENNQILKQVILPMKRWGVKQLGGTAIQEFQVHKILSADMQSLSNAFRNKDIDLLAFQNKHTSAINNFLDVNSDIFVDVAKKTTIFIS